MYFYYHPMEFIGYNISETQDLLNIVLSVGFGCISLILVMVLVRLYKVLGRVNQITESVSEIVEIVEHYLWQPAKIAIKIMENLKKLFGKKK